MSWKCIIKTDATELLLESLGITIPASTTYEAHVDSEPAFKYEELIAAEDLKVAIAAGTAVINDGTDDLSIAQALRHLEPIADLDKDIVDALQGASNPSSTNTFVTQDELTSIGQDTLDSAYDGGGSGVGKTITADSGAVRIQGLGAANAGLSLAPRTTKATTLAEGDIEFMKDGSGNIVPAVYDGTRTKLLSIESESHLFSDGNNTKDRYMYFGQVRSNEAGSIVTENSTLVKAIIKINGTAVTATARIRKKSDLTTDIATVVLTAATSVVVRNLNVDLTANDELVVFWSQTTGSADAPTIKLFTKQRF